MDLSDELKSIEENNVSIDSILYSIFEQQENLEKKAHIFRVIKMIKALETVQRSEFIKQEDLAKIVMKLEYDEEEYYVTYMLYKSNEERFYIEHRDNNLMSFLSTLSQFTDCNVDYMNSAAFDIIINMDSNAQEILLNSFLSDELKSYVQYAMLNNATADKNCSVKRNKL